MAGALYVHSSIILHIDRRAYVYVAPMILSYSTFYLPNCTSDALPLQVVGDHPLVRVVVPTAPLDVVLLLSFQSCCSAAVCFIINCVDPFILGVTLSSSRKLINTGSGNW